MSDIYISLSLSSTLVPIAFEKTLSHKVDSSTMEMLHLISSWKTQSDKEKQEEG